MTSNEYSETATVLASDSIPADRTLHEVPVTVLARLIDEVRNGEPGNAHAYNRQHNRHNR